MNARLVILALFATLLAAPVLAREKYHDAVNAADAAQLDKVAAGIRKNMQPGGRYEFVSPAERKTVDSGLAEMEGLLKQGDPATLHQADKIRLFNAQEKVNSILARRDSERVICKSEAPVGSHIPITTCHTYAQEVEARESARAQMDMTLHTQCRSFNKEDQHCGGQ